MDLNPPSLQCPRVLSAVLPLSKLVHYVGFSMAVGSAVAVTILRRSSTALTGESRRSLESAIARVISVVEIPGIGVVLLGGILAVLANPSVLDEKGGLGAWMFVKVPMVMALAVVSFMKMFGALLLVRERANGASEAECDAHVRRGELLDKASIALAAIILTISAYRYVLFG